ncbi:carboxypeptidase-like regulatory domain-containing protein [uncultured Lacinutrix sp.]|uniref:carboxypeptidase-like regulatory domain-containing protein n=1 Tax=uncultured Lacinutrix sp. TaxID=574032 RepID=UPI00262335CF|nr:carboxypeptidase-like regulatory domain-containing protein [uncultured Lacinutrix sp.]
MKNYAYLLIVLLFTATACQNEQEIDQEFNTENLDQPIILETVVGKVTTSSNKPVANASVTYEKNGTTYSSKTNNSGDFDIVIPVGEGELKVYTGTGRLYNKSLAINVEEGKNLVIDTQDLRLSMVGQIAYLGGDLDSIETVATDAGYALVEISKADIENNAIMAYDALMLNADDYSTQIESAAFYSNLKSFVETGGSLYVSSWGLEYLIGNDEYAQDCGTTRTGGFIDDFTICATRSGAPSLSINNTITDANFATHMSSTTLNLHYELEDWMQINTIDTNFWDVLVEDSAQQPLLIKTNGLYNGVGKINNGVDTPGTIFYATFQNYTEGSVLPRVDEILEYMVLNM